MNLTKSKQFGETLMSRKHQRTINASELNSYLYCKRAWWYAIRGVKAQNEHELTKGLVVHQQHGEEVFLSSLLHLLANIFILVALVLFTIYLTQHFV